MLVVAELGTLFRRQTCIRKELVCSSFVRIFKALTIEPLGNIDRRLGLPTVQDRKRCIAKLTQCSSLGHHRWAPVGKKLTAFRKARGVWNRQRRLITEVATGQGGKRNRQCQRKDKCWSANRNIHRISGFKGALI
jgi:hypothetical protein